MLSRNQIRVKIFHCIYSSYIKNDYSNFDFKNSFNDYKNLYFKVLEILVYLKKRAEFEISHGLKKNFASEDDLNPNKKFINNQILKKIETDINSNYDDDEKKSIAKKIFELLKTKKYFIDYMTNEKNELISDKLLINKIIKNEIFNYNELFDYLENKSIYWNDDILAVQILTSKIVDGFQKNKKNNFKNINIFKNIEDEKFAKNLLYKTIEKRNENTEIIHELAKNWDFDRISILDSILLQLAITEMTEFDTIPYKVSINEYIEIAKMYSTKKSYEFINGILDTFLKKKILI
ncbi:MAG: transcription antitermination factor NusB [Flavobacteriales bacterium]|nr:transcription antitermination factor NusB [Flavobacteriales bacterium]|tara:strand:+ start:5260 stop:6135 length:876 start_codon:yes stop_codon:yes gene_type:complete